MTNTSGKNQYSDQSDKRKIQANDEVKSHQSGRGFGMDPEERREAAHNAHKGGQASHGVGKSSEPKSSSSDDDLSNKRGSQGSSQGGHNGSSGSSRSNNH